MRRLFYVAESVDDAEAVSEAILKQGIKRSRVHVLAKDEAGLYSHKVHSATPLQQLDIVHTGMRYAVLGLIVGLLLGMGLVSLGILGFIELQVGLIGVLALGFVGLCFGAWEGGLVGLSRENYKIERYHDDIEAGRYLLMIDVRQRERSEVRELMNMEFSHVPYRGATDRRARLLDKPKVLHHQTTH